jgi:hypothetical protein
MEIEPRTRVTGTFAFTLQVRLMARGCEWRCSCGDEMSNVTRIRAARSQALPLLV